MNSEEEKEYFHKINFRKKGPGPRKEHAEPSEGPEDDQKEDLASSEVNFPYLKGSASERSVKIDKLLQKIDDNFFVGSKHAYDVFKAFDVDKDGKPLSVWNRVKLA